MAQTLEEIGLRAVLDMANMDENSKRFLSIVDSLTAKVTGFASNSSKSISDASSGLGIFGDAAKRVGDIVNGIIVADIFRGIAREVGNVIDEVLQATSDFQRLQIQFETLAARDFMAEFGGNIDNALQKSSGTAQDLLYWIRQIAVTTPFTVESIGHTLAMSKAFGFTTEEAKKLVLSVGDFTAGMGLTDDVLKRIIYNMGQMAAAGKPTGRELRDLSNSFVPVMDIAQRMGDQMGKTKQEMLKMFSTGAVSARQFIDEFQKLVAEQFPGAMARMSNTFEGVTNNVKDFLQSVIGFQILGPIATKMATDLQTGLKSLLNPETFALADAAGETLAFVYDKLSMVVGSNVVNAFNTFFSTLGVGIPTITGFAEGIMTVAANLSNLGAYAAQGLVGVSQGIQNILSFFGTSFSQLSSDMFGWGSNVILQFARGIVQGIIFVIQAITAVANTITSMLQANSPPLILPELEAWGTNAMMAYMDGWKKADFSAFSDIGGLLESAIMSWSGRFESKDLVLRVIGSTVTMSKAVEEFRKFGDVSENTLNQISDAAGFASEKFKEFIELSLQLSRVQDISNAVKSALDFSGTGQIDIFGKTISSFQDLISMSDQFGSNLSDSIRSYASGSSRLVEINNAIAVSQERINSATKFYDDILAKLNSELAAIINRQEDLGRVSEIDSALRSKILTTAERERLELEKKRIMLEREIKTTQQQKDQVISAEKAKIDLFDVEKKGIEDLVKFQKDQIKSLSDAQLKAAQDQLSAVKSNIQTQIHLNELLSKALADSSKKGAGDVAQDLQDALSGIGAGGLNFEKIKLAFDDMWLEIKKQADKAWKDALSVFDPITVPFNNMMDSIGILLQNPKLKKSFEDFVDQIKIALKPLQDWWDKDGSKLAESIGVSVGIILGSFVAKNEKTGKSFLDIIGEGIAAIAKSLADSGPKLTEFFDHLQTFLTDSAIPAVQEALSTIATEVIPALIRFAAEAAPKILDILGFVVRNWKEISIVLLGLKALMILSVIGPIVFALSTLLPGVLTALLGITLLPEAAMMIAAGALFITIKEKGPEALRTLQDIENIFELIGSGKVTIKQVIESTVAVSKTEPQIPVNEKTMFPGGKVDAPAWFQEMADKISGIIQPLMFNISQWWTETFGMGGTLGTTFSTFSADMNTQFSKYGQQASDTFNNIKIDVEKWWNGAFGPEGTIPVGFNTFVTGMQTQVATYGQQMSDSFGLIKTTIEKWLNDTFGPEGTIITGFNTFILSSVKNFDQWILDVSGKFSQLGTDLSTWATNIFGEKGTLITGIQAFLEPFQKWWDSVFAPGGSLSQWFDSMFSEGGVVSTFLTNMVTFGEQILVSIIDGMENRVDWVKSVFGIILEGLINDIRKLFGVDPTNGSQSLGSASGSSGSTSPFIPGSPLPVHGLGGSVWKGIPSIVGDKGPEMFVPSSDGIILPNDFFAKLLSGITKNISSVIKSSVISSPVNITNDYSRKVYVQINPTYASVQSPVAIYNDVTAALAASRI